MNNKKFIFLPVIVIIFSLIYYSYGIITIDTQIIVLAIAISAIAIILALAKNDKDNKDEK